MAINFPDSPTDGQEFITGGRVFIYDASRSSWFKSIQNTSLSGLSDVDTASPTADQNLTFNGSVWTNMDAGGGLITYTSVSGLPTSGNSNGDLAFVTANNRLYIWNGGGWYSIALINQSPTTITGNDASYELNTEGTPVVLTLVSEDPEGFPLTWSYSISSGTLGSTATIEQANNVFTITPSTTTSDAGSFGVTFSVTEGTNVTTSISSFTLAFGPSHTNAIENSYGDYMSLTWEVSGTVIVSAPVTCDILVIAGGGAGGAPTGKGGGGGAGGMIVETNYILPSGTHNIVIGQGGNMDGGWTQHQVKNRSGENTTVGDITDLVAIGGGAGGNENGPAPEESGYPGGSGGGYSHDSSGNQGGSGTAGQGYSAPNFSQIGAPYEAGGGGGAGGIVTNNNNGGPGLENNFRDGTNYFYAAGGGGMSPGGGGAYGIGGSNIGGSSPYPYNDNTPTNTQGSGDWEWGDRNGKPNTGSGGGVGNQGTYGGSGIVVIRWQQG